LPPARSSASSRVVVIVGSYRLALAALGLDRSRLSVTLEQGRIIIKGQSYEALIPLDLHDQDVELVIVVEGVAR
jgi:hypothetical protein